MISLEIHSYPVRRQHGIQGISDILSDALLDSEALGK
jgi:hypothetical protein